MCNLLFSNLLMLPKTKKNSNEMLMCQFNLNLDEKNSVLICLQYIIVDVDSQKKLEFDGVRLLLLSCNVFLFLKIKEKYLFLWNKKVHYVICKSDIVLLRGGWNYKFHYYDRPLLSEHWKCLFSFSLLRHQNIESLTCTAIKVKNYLWRFPPIRLG